jgi:hypothetical protein
VKLQRVIAESGATPRTRQSGAGLGSQSISVFLVLVFWVLVVFEVDWFLTKRIGGPFFRIPMLLAPVLGLMVLLRGDRRMIYWPMILFVGLHVAASLLAENAGNSRDALKFMLYMVLLFASSVSFLDSPPKMIVVLKLYLLGFAWFGLQGLTSGLVFWHPLLANEDSYGPLMVVSMAFSYFFALATSSPLWRWIARGMFLVSVVGVVMSFARGAALAAAVVLLQILVRSPQRAKIMTGLVLATIALLPMTGLLLSVDAYIQELASISEGDKSRTTGWRVARMVFEESPVYGVGALNFGVVASRITPIDLARLMGKGDVAQLWSHTVHNPHFQILAEEGLIGIALWIGMIVSFFRWNRRLRTRDASALWNGREGDDLDLDMIARGLEGSMVGFLATSIFYNQLYVHWFWSLLTISYVLLGLTHPIRASASERRGANPTRWLGAG